VSELVTLAADFVRLSSEIEEVRRRMLSARRRLQPRRLKLRPLGKPARNRARQAPGGRQRRFPSRPRRTRPVTEGAKGSVVLN
jgi:hypothetical protein